MNTIHRLPVGALLLASFISLTASGQEPARPGDTNPPRQTMPGDATTRERSMPAAKTAVSPSAFTSQAAIIGQAEIELGKLALQNSNDAAVKRYGERMVSDHTAAAAKLRKAAEAQNLTLPKELDAQHKAVKDKLAKLKGEEFDAAYTAEMAKGHDKAVALFESAAQSTTLPSDLKQFAASTLPTLQQHREMAHELHGKEGA